MATYSNTAREVEMPNGDVVVIHNAPTGGENTTSNIKKFKYDDNGHVTESDAANATDLNLSSYSTPTTGSTAIGTSDAVQTAIGKLDHQSQIDQSNILLVEKYGGGINKLCFSRPSGTVNEVVYTINDDKSITVYTNGAVATTRSINLTFTDYDQVSVKSTDIVTGLNSYPGNGLYFGWGINASGNTGVLYSSDVSKPIGTSGYIRYFALYIADGVNIPQENAFTVYPMIVDADDFNGLSGYQPYALPNYDLTRLEAEDRASLAEVVDSGAKNELQPTWTTQEINGVKFTVGSDGVITATTTGTRTSTAIYPLLSRYSGTKMTGKVMSISPKGGTNASYYVAAEQADSPWHNVGTDYGDGVVISSEANNKDINVNIVIPANYSPNNLKFSPMLCTKAAFGVSNKFVPYRPNWDLVVATIDTKAPTLSSSVVTSGSLDDITVSSFALYSNNVSGMPSGFTNSYAFVRTTMYDYTTGMQELFAQSGSAAGTAYVRTKSSNTWTTWKQITNT